MSSHDVSNHHVSGGHCCHCFMIDQSHASRDVLLRTATDVLSVDPPGMVDGIDKLRESAVRVLQREFDNAVLPRGL